jgi:hypothetical protein
VTCGGSTLIGENQRKRQNLDPLLYVKDFGHIIFNWLKLIIYKSVHSQTPSQYRINQIYITDYIFKSDTSKT